MVKALAFKGDKKPAKKRKRAADPADETAAPSSKQLVPADAHENAPVEDDENWVTADAVSDLAGPVILVLSSEPVMALACDQLGAVFASKIENMVEGVAGSAEPHDVRQVFVVTRVVGSETDVVLKGCNGRYLGCDQIGTLSTTREAISPEETFKCLPSTTGPGLFTLQTTRNTYLSIDGDASPPTIRGDAEEESPATEIRIRMQARFKPKHKVEKAEKVRAKISRKELEDEVGRRLEDEEVKVLKKARREGNFHEVMLDVKVKGKHDKFASA